MKTLKKALAFALALMMVLSLAACGSSASTDSSSDAGTDEASTASTADRKVIITGTGLTDSHFGTRALEEMKKYLDENTDTLTMEIYSNGEIGADKDVLEAIQYGTATLNIPTPAVMANFAPAFNLLSLPFVFEDAETAHDLLDGEWGEKLAATAESAGFKVLGIGDYGFRQLTTSKKQVNSLADYSGLKIRVMQNNLYVATYTALGANPTPMASGEVFTALQQNVVDGQENPLSNIYTQKYNEVQSYILKDNHVCDFLVFAFSKEFYDGLTADEQEALQAAVDVAVEYTREQCAADDAECEAEMAESLTITEISDSFRQECVDATASVRDEYGKAADEALYTEMMEALG